MTTETSYNFAIGDILLFEGESYQVHENNGTTGSVSLFPSVDVELMTVEWNEGYRKIGNAALPAPTPCASGSCTPPSAKTDVKVSNVETIKIC